MITHARFPEQLRQTKNVRSEVSYMRAVRQFGSELAGENNPILVRCGAMINDCDNACGCITCPK